MFNETLLIPKVCCDFNVDGFNRVVLCFCVLSQTRVAEEAGYHYTEYKMITRFIEFGYYCH